MPDRNPSYFRSSIDEKLLQAEDDEQLRLKYEACPACGADLGTDIERMTHCPVCGEEL